MWDSYCALALDGGPAHRPTLLDFSAEVESAEAYDFYTEMDVAREIVRGIYEVSGRESVHGMPHTIMVFCRTSEEAIWMVGAMTAEGVGCRRFSELAIELPVRAEWTVEKEVKNVITAVAKCTHYWDQHVALVVPPTHIARLVSHKKLSDLY